MTEVIAVTFARSAQKRKRWKDGTLRATRAARAGVTGMRIELFAGDQPDRSLARDPLETMFVEGSQLLQEYEFKNYLVDIGDLVGRGERPSTTLDDRAENQRPPFSKKVKHCQSQLTQGRSFLGKQSSIVKERTVAGRSELAPRKAPSFALMRSGSLLSPCSGDTTSEKVDFSGQGTSFERSTSDLLGIFGASDRQIEGGTQAPDNGNAVLQQTRNKENRPLARPCRQFVASANTGFVRSSQPFVAPAQTAIYADCKSSKVDGLGSLRLTQAVIGAVADRRRGDLQSLIGYIQHWSSLLSKECQFDLVALDGGAEERSRFYDDCSATLYRTGGKKDTPYRFFLESDILKRREVRRGCRSGDLWYISTRDFKTLQDRSAVWVFRSVWHGASSEGTVEVAQISDNFRASAISSRWSAKTRVYCKKGRSNVDQAVYAIEALKALTLQDPPIMPHLLCQSEQLERLGPLAHLTPGPDILDKLFAQVVQEFHLNEDQSAILAHVRGWFDCANRAPSGKMLLVHGPFGSGKTTMLCALILFLSRALGDFGQDSPSTSGDTSVRICVASATNIAVDNVLVRLLELGFDSLVRVGSLRAIHKSLLCHTVHSHPKGFKAALDDAKVQLGFAKHQTAEARQLLDEIEKTPAATLAKAQRTAQHRARVIGVTCNSAGSKDLMNELFEGKTSVCFVDEAACSTEPLTLLPLAKARADCCILVGDPNQLPPVVRSSDAGIEEQLSVSMFSRLSKSKPNLSAMLKTQYRCHPEIGNLASKLFYDGLVKSGVASSQRPSLFCDLRPLVLFDVSDGEERAAGTAEGHCGYTNNQERRVTVALVKKMLRSGLKPSDMCVICQYVAQVAGIQSSLKSDTSGLETDRVAVSTIDAFQGSERKIVIVSTCRTKRCDSLRFLDDKHRLNVMVTRAQNHLFIVGNRATLAMLPNWGAIARACSWEESIEAFLQ